jgi:hypothetical protein
MIGADDGVAAGVVAWKRLNEHGRTCWDDWLTVARALLIGRTAALQAAETNRAVGSKYNAAMGRWLRDHGLADVVAQERYRLLLILENCRRSKRGAPTSTRGSIAGSTIPALSGHIGGGRSKPTNNRCIAIMSLAARTRTEPAGRSTGRKMRSGEPPPRFASAAATTPSRWLASRWKLPSAAKAI